MQNTVIGRLPDLFLCWLDEVQGAHNESHFNSVVKLRIHKIFTLNLK